MGQGCQSVSLAWGHNDRSRSSTDCCTQNRVSIELGLPLHVAYATRDPKPFHNKQVPGTVGKYQSLGGNRRYCEVLQHLGRDFKRSFGASKHCEVP